MAYIIYVMHSCIHIIHALYYNAHRCTKKSHLQIDKLVCSPSLHPPPLQPTHPPFNLKLAKQKIVIVNLVLSIVDKFRCDLLLQQHPFAGGRDNAIACIRDNVTVLT